MKHQGEILDKSLHYCREKSRWGYKYGSGHMKEMNIPVQKIHFLRQVKKPDGGWKGVGKAVGKLWTPGSPSPPGREQQLRSHGRASAPLDEEKGLGGKSRRNRVSPKKYRSDKKIGAQSRVGLKHRAMFSTFGSLDHYCEPGIVNTGP